MLGLPMTLKESEAMAGLPQTAGIPDLKGYIAPEDGPAFAIWAARARAASMNGA